MRYLRLLIIAIATICVLALGAFALVNRPPAVDPGDDIIIKGGSLKITCGTKHGKDCFGGREGKNTYEHTKSGKIQQVTIKNSSDQDLRIFTRVELGDQPTIVINYAN
jgi:hypothetical protein